MNREELKTNIKKILDEEIYAEYNSEIHDAPKVCYPDEMIDHILDLLKE